MTGAGKHVLGQMRAEQLHAERQVVRRDAVWQRDGRTPGEVEDCGEAQDADQHVPRQVQLVESDDYYRSPRPHSPKAFADAYKVKCPLEPSITFLGIWNTVGSLGIPGSLMAASNKEKFAFHDTTRSPFVKHAVHALAIDEHRHDFTPTFWTGDVPPGATIQQVWFAGAHSDVGGGYNTRTLADIPLIWMARRSGRPCPRLELSARPHRA